ncbi:MAG: hypothetical protein LC791_10825 [Acidobacteria bacterium]|nr:hypothetical protein [Acidobacteriota bacterium]
MPFIAMELVTGQPSSASRRRDTFSSDALALVYTGLAERDEAFAWLRRAHDERAWGMAFVNVEADFDSLRADPRFAVVIAK